ncbi:hypothetical protein [Calothrix sp. NIES-3974]|uniref:hypothetical protein n=1 Tax=Calothrix sp. NIES-3974 TaxID=2005462 RepID=UPI000B5E5BE5|nr:hypothetical protein [Calothrix sp. NIES-3974]BAZ05260.1 hypothetical protein NIES3974_19060 [Calothrix sp. NIES-3974]
MQARLILQAAVNANDAIADGKLFAIDAIWIPSGSEPEDGRGKVFRHEQKDYDVAK